MIRRFFARLFGAREPYVFRTGVRLTDDTIVETGGIASAWREGDVMRIEHESFRARKDMNVNSIILFSPEGEILNETPLTGGPQALRCGDTMRFTL